MRNRICGFLIARREKRSGMGIPMIRVLVDASSDYSLEEVRQKNLIFVPIQIAIGNNNYIEGVNLQRNDFYSILEKTGLFPQTSQPSPQAFLDIFQKAKAQGDELICILLSSSLSGTFQSAALAKSMADYEGIYLIDSLSATFTIKILADYALRLAGEGQGAPQIVREIEQLKKRVKVLACLDTLEYLSRGGRIGKTAASLGDLANLKPIITLDQTGRVAVTGKCLGRNKGIHHVLAQMLKTPLDRAFPVYTIYSFGTSNCEKFEEKLRQNRFSFTGRLQIGPTIGAHIGPEAFGIIYVEKARPSL